MTARPIRRPFNSKGLYRRLHKRLNLPGPFVHGALSAVKRLTVHAQLRHRKALAAALPAEGWSLDPASGYAFFSDRELPGAGEAARRCAELYTKCRESGADREILSRSPNKRFLLALIAGNEFREHPELLRFMLLRPLLDLAARYLGSVPVLEGAALWWTPPNDSVHASQAWHVDGLAPHQVKVQLNCLEVTDDQGPLHLLPSALSDAFRRRIGHQHGRLEDSNFADEGLRGQIARTTGPMGSGVVFDSSRCLHYGSRGNHRDRLVLTFHFFTLDTLIATRHQLHLNDLPKGCEGLDEVQRLALGFH